MVYEGSIVYGRRAAASILRRSIGNTRHWREFLESFPVNTAQVVSEYWGTAEREPKRLAPTLRLYCWECEGIRNFIGHWRLYDLVRDTKWVNDFLEYTCRECAKAVKTFSIGSKIIGDPRFGLGFALKIGETPEAHVELPLSLKSLLGDDYGLFLKGLQCEKQGLGVGAFTYYRRVVESQKSQLIAEIRRVAEKIGAPQEMLETLARAAKEKQFTRAVEAVKDAIPQALLVDSHNPLKLLHDALSIGVHGETDENCPKYSSRCPHGPR